MEDVLSFTTEEAEVIISSIAGVFAVLLGAWKFYAARKALFDMGGKALSFAVTEVSKRTENTVDDKFALFLQHLTGQLEAKGKAPVSETKARAVFDALHGKAVK